MVGQSHVLVRSRPCLEKPIAQHPEIGLGPAAQGSWWIQVAGNQGFLTLVPRTHANGKGPRASLGVMALEFEVTLFLKINILRSKD